VVVVDPKWPNARLARVGRDVAFSWLTLNRIRLPDRIYFDRASAGDLIAPTWLGAHLTVEGFSVVGVSTRDCPRGSRTRSIVHAPASFEDFTPYGVLCHEVGHHVDRDLHPAGYSNVRSSGFKKAIDEEMEVSSGESNLHESFAEAIRLFVTNPNLLEVGRPARWEYLRSRYRPLHDASWRTVLSKASDVVHRAVEEWLDEG